MKITQNKLPHLQHLNRTDIDELNPTTVGKCKYSNVSVCAHIQYTSLVIWDFLHRPQRRQACLGHVCPSLGHCELSGEDCSRDVARRPASCHLLAAAYGEIHINLLHKKQEKHSDSTGHCPEFKQQIVLS